MLKLLFLVCFIFWWLPSKCQNFPDLPGLNDKAADKLFNAVAKNDLKLLEEALADPAVNLTARNDKGETALHLACLGTQLTIVQRLISFTNDMGADLIPILEATQSEGRTPLFYTAQATNGTLANRGKVIVELLQAGADMYHVDIYDMQPIHAAIVYKNLPMAQQLLRSGGDQVASAKCCSSKAYYLKFGGVGNKTMSHLIAEYDFADAAVSLKDYFNATVGDALGQKPACYAASNGSINFLTQAKDLMASTSASCVYFKTDKLTVVGFPLHAAAFYGQQPFLKFMLDNNMNISVKDSAGGSVLHAVGRGGQGANLETMVADVFKVMPQALEMRDLSGKTPLLLAVEASSLRMLQLLYLQYGADATVRDSDGQSALHLMNDIQVTQYLLITNHIFDAASIDARTISTQSTPLHIAVAQRKDLRIINLLISQHANKAATNALGQNVAHLAAGADYAQALEVFRLQPEINFLARDLRGRTPLLYALMQGAQEAARNLITNPTSADSLIQTVTNSLDSALHIAVGKNNSAMVSLLVDATSGSLLQMANWAKELPLHIAVQRQFTDIVKYLHGKNSASWRALDGYGRSVFHMLSSQCGQTAGATVNSWQELANFLFAALRDANDDKLTNALLRTGTDRFDQTATELAVKRNCIDLVVFLLKQDDKIAGTNCGQRDANHLDLVQLAMAMGHSQLADTLADLLKGCSRLFRIDDLLSKANAPSCSRGLSDLGWHHESDADWANGCDFGDATAKTFTRVPADRCGQTCADNPPCTHFVWTNTAGGACFLKNRKQVSNDDAYAVSDRSAVCGLLVPSDVIKWNRLSDSSVWAFRCDFAGNDLKWVVVSGDRCGQTCIDNPPCTHFVWTTWQDGTCFLKSGKVTTADATLTTDKLMVCGII